MNILQIVTSIEEMVDKTKLYVMNGTIWKYEARYDVIVPINEIPNSTNSDKTPYIGENGEQGYKYGYYIAAGTGQEVGNAGYRCTGFIPIKSSDTFRIQNYSNGGISYDNITFYNDSFEYVGAFTASSSYNPLSQFEQDGIMEGCISTANTTNFTATQKDSIAYMRLSFTGINSNTSCIINIFDETAEFVPQSWHDTRFPYYGDAIANQNNTITNSNKLIDKILRYMGLHT